MAIRASGVTMAALVHGPGQPGRGADVGPGVSSVDLPLDGADVEFDRPSVSWMEGRQAAGVLGLGPGLPGRCRRRRPVPRGVGGVQMPPPPPRRLDRRHVRRRRRRARRVRRGQPRRGRRGRREGHRRQQPGRCPPPAHLSYLSQVRCFFSPLPRDFFSAQDCEAFSV